VKVELKKIFKILLITILLIVILDQASKLALNLCATGDIEVIKNFFTITKVENKGMAFGLNKQNLVNIFLGIVIIGLIINYMITQKANLTTKSTLFLSLIIAGGISNLIDRVFRGAVLDFIKLGDFPVFNIADCSVVIGWVLFVINFIAYSSFEIKASLKSKKESKK
jgi:signal peptidase II